MTVSEIDAVVVEIGIAAAPGTVFAYLVDPDKIVRWMGVRANLDPRPGGTYALEINPKLRASGRYLEVVPPSRVVFTFGWDGDQATPPGFSTVEVTLTPEGDGTHVRLVHRGLVALVRDDHRNGWEHYLGRLNIVATAGDPGPDPNAATQLH